MSSAKLRALRASRSIDIATTRAPRFFHSRFQPSNTASSLRHGAHHVAQKFTTMTSPRSDDSVIFLPASEASSWFARLAAAALIAGGVESGAPRAIDPRGDETTGPATNAK